ncbi:uncharacterized protein LOC144168303 [Haemaphysalis longicornis]
MCTSDKEGGFVVFEFSSYRSKASAAIAENFRAVEERRAIPSDALPGAPIADRRQLLPQHLELPKMQTLPQARQRATDETKNLALQADSAEFMLVNGTDATVDRICLVLHSMSEKARRNLMQQLTRATYAAPRSHEEESFADQIQEQWDAFVAKVKQVARSTWDHLARRMSSSLEQLAT